jgi:hypothetical protein
MPKPINLCVAILPVAIALVVTGISWGEPHVSSLRIDVDPTTAPVISPPPPLFNPLDDASYATRYAEALWRIGPAVVSKDEPTMGASITKIYPSSIAERAGLGVDDVIVAIDGRPTPDADTVKVSHRDATGPQTFDVISQGRPVHRMIRIDPGHLGMDVTDTWLLERQYLHDLPPGVAPVDEVRVAGCSVSHDPELAESALFRAFQAPGPGTRIPIVDAIAACAFYEDNWYEEALAYAEPARTQLPANCQNRLNEIIAISAIATFRPSLANAVAVTGTDDFHKLITNAVDAGASYQLRPHSVALPNPSATKLVFIDQTQQVAALPGNHPVDDDDLKSVRATANLPFSAPDAHYTTFECGPGEANVDFSADCHFIATDNGKSGFEKVVRIGVSNDVFPMRVFELFPGGRATTGMDRNTVDAVTLVPRLTGGDRKFKLRMTIVGDRCEFDLDGHRIFYGPMPPELAYLDAKLTLLIQTVGVTGEFTNIHWRTSPRHRG